MVMKDNFFCVRIEYCKIIHFVIVAVINLEECFVVKVHIVIFKFIYIIG